MRIVPILTAALVSAALSALVVGALVVGDLVFRDLVVGGEALLASGGDASEPENPAVTQAPLPEILAKGPTGQTATPAPNPEAVSVLVHVSVARDVASGVVLRGQTVAARRGALRAQTGGEVIAAPMRRGATGTAGAPLCALDPMKVVGDLPETEIGKVSLGAQVEVRRVEEPRVEGQHVEGQHVEVRPLLGKVTALARSSDPATHRLRVEAELQNPEAALRDGETALCDPKAALRDAEAGLHGGDAALRDAETALRGGETVDLRIATASAPATARAHLVPASALVLDDTGVWGLRLAVPQAVPQTAETVDPATANNETMGNETMGNEAMGNEAMANETLNDEMLRNETAGMLARFAPVLRLRDTPEGVLVTGVLEAGMLETGMLETGKLGREALGMGLPERAYVIVRGQDAVAEGTPRIVTFDTTRPPEGIARPRPASD